MSEKRFEFKLKVNFIDEETGEEIYHKVLIDNSNENEIGFDDMVELLNQLHQENTSLNKKITPSIYNKHKGDWKWNVDNNTILNIRTGEIFYLRNSGAVENLVGLLNTLQDENEQLKNELRKEKSLREYSDSLYGRDMFVNIRFRNGKWKADVSVIDDE